MASFEKPDSLALEAIEKGLKMIEKLKSDLSAMEQLVKSSCESLSRDIAVDLEILSSTREQRLSAAEYLYWMVPQIPIKTIETDLLGGDQRLISEMKSNAVLSPVKCAACGQQESVKVTSRVELQEKQAEVKRGTVICDSCRTKQEAKQRAEQVERERRYEAEREAARARREELQTMPYREYLQTDEWKAIRNAAFRSAGFACELCNRRDVKLNAHHKTYENRGRENTWDLTVLCENCHRLFHFGGTLSNSEQVMETYKEKLKQINGRVPPPPQTTQTAEATA
jgi:5-methylcytosine-specific restriction endonuclease McrA